jgi:hypothetical protein
MATKRKVECGEHGAQDATFVCQHVVLGLREGIPYGFWWALDPGTPRPDAWCTACNEMVAASDGEWTSKAEEFAGVTLLCGGCYDRAHAMNLPGRGGERTG